MNNFSPQEPPQDYRIFNRRQPDGTFRSLSEFFDKPIAEAETECPLCGKPSPGGDVHSACADYENYLSQLG